jgi:hypothetical protein
LRAQHFVKPEPGVLVLFPSYMWRGAAPFHGEGMRLMAATPRTCEQTRQAI